MFSKNHPILIYLDRNGFILYQDSLSNILQFPFSQDLVRDLEVINREQLIYLIRTFIQKNNIVPSALVIVLSDSVVFQKEIPIQTATSRLWSKELQEREIQNFLENIPFEDILAKIIKRGSATRLVSVNKDLVDTLIYAFRSQGSIVESIVPSLVYEDSIDLSHGLTMGIAKAVLRRGELLRQANLLTGQQTINATLNPDASQSPKEEKPKNMKLYLLIAIFVTLLIILGVVYFSLAKTPRREASVTPSVAAKASREATNTVTLSLPSEVIDLKNIKIKIVSSKEKETQTTTLKKTLLTLGFKDINIEIATGTLPAKSAVLFTKGISQDTRQKTMAVIKRISSDVIIQENQDSEPIITILLGAS